MIHKLSYESVCIRMLFVEYANQHKTSTPLIPEFFNSLNGFTEDMTKLLLSFPFPRVRVQEWDVA